MSKQSLHSYVSGIVQGVFFRDSTCKKAKELGLTGWVKNLSDGRVEVMASGDKAKLDELEKWLHQGPPAAKVDAVSSEFVDFEVFDVFKVLF